MTYLHHKSAAILDAGYRRAIEERILSRTRRVGDCVVFTGDPKREYGRVSVANITGGHNAVAAHAVMYLLRVGDIPKGMDVGHLCNVKRCVNVAHLKLMTRSENHLQARKDGLQRGVLTPRDVQKIRSLLAAGGKTQREIARMFGTYQQTVSRIKRGLSFHWT